VRVAEQRLGRLRGGPVDSLVRAGRRHHGGVPVRVEEPLAKPEGPDRKRRRTEAT
jgi:hypothetical protein